ncbi:zinc-binding dehydrogenase [Methylobacterium sp. OT2]|uniref:zinc-binding dehydrogenase n=1 Tax=Methylobacterium sp. OT2 TaxID=2813779 RepID=UPI00197C85BE|nr:zinc-binding dehydrogenase [Methylobacterium sp. OT2]MBN4096010.1 zinc-binding dehydrogenase [Methylobacterium sp. OT2]
MKAICVTADRRLQVRDIPTPTQPPPGHVLVDMAASAITHGDKFFLTRPLPGAAAFSSTGQDVYGANGAGTVVALGAGVPQDYAGKQVAIYKSLVRSPDSVGVWCERAQVPYESCLILPDRVRARDYCGSFANILTVEAFFVETAAAGHKGIIVTAGNSATGRIAVSLARRHGIPAIFLVRSNASRERLLGDGATHVIDTAETGFEGRLGDMAERMGATAVFDGVGGELLSRVMPVLPMNATVYIYGFLGGTAPIVLPTMLLLGRNLTLRRFANLDSAIVSDPDRLAMARREIEGWIGDPLFETRTGREFPLDQISEAMAYEASPGARAILVA